MRAVHYSPRTDTLRPRGEAVSTRITQADTLLCCSYKFTRHTVTLSLSFPLSLSPLILVSIAAASTEGVRREGGVARLISQRRAWMRALVSLVSRCSRFTHRTIAPLAAQLHYHSTQLTLFSTTALPPFQLLAHTPPQPPSPLYAIVGLGNPGPMFVNTRHNVGAMCLQHIASTYSLSFKTHSPLHLCQLAQCIRPLPLTLTRSHPSSSPPPSSPPRHLLLALPTTYMNDSGRAVLGLMCAYRLPSSHLIALYDDVHLPLGTIRIAHRGSPAGHNGLTDILQRLRAAGRGQALVRVRVGVGKVGMVESGGLAAYVLGKFTREEVAVLEGEVYGKVKRAVEGIAAGEVDRMMNMYNGKQNRNAAEQTGEQSARLAEKRGDTPADQAVRAAVT